MENKRIYRGSIVGLAMLIGLAGLLIVVVGHVFYTKASDHAIWYLNHFFGSNGVYGGENQNGGLYNYAEDVIRSRERLGRMLSACFGVSLIINAMLLFINIRIKAKV